MDSAEQPHHCKCKVGSCPLCGSACKRCGCACDGVEPGVALARSSGQRGPKRLSTGSEQREAAKRARIEIAKATELEERTIGTEPTIKQVETVHDLWQGFGWSQATKKKLPNEDLRKGDVLLKESGCSGWSTMVQSVLAAVVRCAEFLYPANSNSLLEEVATRLSQSSSSITTKDENRVTENTIMIMNASQKRSIQARVARAILVKGLPGHRIQSLKRDGVFTHREKLQKLSAAIGKVVKEAKGYFARCNDMFYMECEGEWATQKLTGIEELTKAEIVFNIRCFAYSGIGDGVTFRTSLKTGLFRPCSCNASVNDLEADSKDDDDESTDIGGEELSVDANEVADYIFHVEGDDNEVEDQDEGEENDEDEIYSEDEDNEIAPAGFSGYGESDLLRGAELLTGACIQKRSCLSNIMGPRNQHRSVRNPHAGPGNGQLIRQDMVAAAVQLASILITNHSVNITNGHSEMEEYYLAAHLEISEKNHNHKHQGWARRPQRGAQYGRAYLEPYKKDIKRMFERGARVSSDKMSPCAMLEELQSLYPGRYTLPGENEIRAEITKLFGRKKASDEDNAGSDHDESENEATKGRGSNLPKQYVKHLEELVERNPTIKPAEALRNLKAALCLPHPFEHDKAIKTKVSSLKRKIKVREKANIL